MVELRRVCVFCGSKHGRQTAYTVAAGKVGRVLAQRGITLVYGGGDVGLMGELADAALAEGGEVLGVIPGFMVDHEVAHHEITELEVVDSMHERKARMATLADAFIALPGGWGTLEELFEIVTWAQLGLHDKPVGLLDVGGFYGELLSFLDRAVSEGFIKEKHRALLLGDDDVNRLLDRLAAFVPPTGTKWAGDDRT
jgi:uncharacterized protein (TIGR00730 family)